MQISTTFVAAALALGASTVSAAPLGYGGFGSFGRPSFGSGNTGGFGSGFGGSGSPGGLGNFGGFGSGNTGGFGGGYGGSGGFGESFAGPGSTGGLSNTGGLGNVGTLPGLGASSGSASGCGAYTIISTRGTSEMQGPSAGFRAMISNTLKQVAGGVEYDTRYPADFSQVSTAGTRDILNKIKTKLAQCPDHKFALLGYSQGAAATTEAINQIKDDATFQAVKAVVLIGNPRRMPNKKADVDNNGGQATRLARGMQAFQGGISDKWDQSGKVLDICAPLDGVCDSATGAGISIAHITAYGGGNWVQNAGTKLMVSGLAKA